jgi:hypothetical protein
MQGPTILTLRLGIHPSQVARTTRQQPRELCVVIDALLEHQRRMEHLVSAIDPLTTQLPASIVDQLVERLRSDHACLQSLISQLSTARSTGGAPHLESGRGSPGPTSHVHRSPHGMVVDDGRGSGGSTSERSG